MPEYKKIYQFQVHIGPYDEKAVQQAKERQSCFVLITNVLEDDKYSDLDILSELKKQSSVEISFKFIKNPIFIGPIFLEKNERIRKTRKKGAI